VTGRIVASLLLALALVSPAPARAEPAHAYVGVKKCKNCHGKELYGDQVGVWRSNSIHANAYASLASEAGIEAARRAGIEGSPQQAGECLKCHVTAYSVPPLLIKYEVPASDGVSCEACHGAGADFRKKSIMSDQDEAVAHGLVRQSAEVCVSCHNEESPFHDPKRYQRADGTSTSFDYDQAIEKIRHPIPEDVRGKIKEIEDELEAEKERKKKRRR
jgi:hypothetical protein